MSFISPSLLAMGLKQTTQILNSDAINKTAIHVTSASKAIGEIPAAISEVKDKFTGAIAEANIKNMLGVGNSLPNKENELRAKLIDPQFLNAQNFFKRIHNSFIPEKFPSREKINLKKSCINKIMDNGLKGKDTNFEYINKNGETIKGFVSKKSKKQGEDCFYVQIKRIFDNASESIETRYYPKSFEIRSVAKDANGKKTISIIKGDNTGGKFKTNTQPSSCVGSKLNIVSK